MKSENVHVGDVLYLAPTMEAVIIIKKNDKTRLVLVAKVNN
jgi:hypothetical protein